MPSSPLASRCTNYAATLDRSAIRHAYRTKHTFTIAKCDMSPAPGVVTSLGGALEVAHGVLQVVQQHIRRGLGGEARVAVHHIPPTLEQGRQIQGRIDELEGVHVGQGAR